jgi:hypothetical protein
MIWISPPTTDTVLPSDTPRELPWTVIATGVGPKNPKAAGDAVVKVLVWPKCAEKVAPSAKRR